MTARVLLVDDNPRVLSALWRTLRRHGYDILTAEGPEAAIEALHTEEEIAAIVCDYQMPGATGVRVLAEAARERPDAARIMLTGHADLNAALAAINQARVSQFLLKPWEDDHLVDVVGQAVRQYDAVHEVRELHEVTRQQRDALEALNEQLEEKVRQRTYALHAAYDETLASLVLALDLREHSTAGHSRRVALYALFLAMRAGVESHRLEALYRGAMLHDIGKIGVPDAVLLKPGKLNDDEWRLMQQHALVAKHLLEPVGYLQGALPIPLYHHERFDGSGYPEGIAGETIPVEARIFAVIDVYDALRTERPYKAAMSHESAVEIIEREAGSHFDPRIANLFLGTPVSTWDALAETSSDVTTFRAARDASQKQCEALEAARPAHDDNAHAVMAVEETL